MMNPEEIIEGNKLIAEFMGAEKDGDFSYIFPEKIGTSLLGEEGFEYLDGTKWWPIEQIQFHSSWDWLMPVVDKINCSHSTLGGIDEGEFFESKKYSVTGRSIGGIEIEHLWESIVRFIKWYNENKNNI